MTEHSPEDFANRFKSLCDEAKEYGISSLFAVVDEDVFKGEDSMFFGWRGGYYIILGAVTSFSDRLKDEKRSTFEADS